MKFRLFLALILNLVIVSQSYGARPMMTDDARMVDAQACQVESWVKNNHGSTEYWALPACNPFGFFELTLGGSYTHQNDDTHLTDKVIQAKTLFRELEANDWSVGLAMGSVRHPTQSTPSQRYSDLYGYVPFTKSLNDDQQFLHINLGAIKRQADGAFSRTWGVGSEILVVPNTYLILETYGQSMQKPAYQAGLRHWLVPNHVQVDMTIGSTSEFNHNSRWVSVGLRLLSPSFLPR